MTEEIRLRERRADLATALRVQHALLLRAQGGPGAAARYLRQADVAAEVVRRVSAPDQRLRRASAQALRAALR